MLVDCLQTFQLLFYSGYIDLFSVEYSLELAKDKGIEAGIGTAKVNDDFDDGICVESIEEDVTGECAR